jgi:hypothetical protein
MNFHHRPSDSDGIPQPVPGFVAGGPNSRKEDGERYPFSEPAKCYVDVLGSYASNEVCINWNSPMTALFAGIDAVLGDSSVIDFEVQTSANNPPDLTITSPYYNKVIDSDQDLIVKCIATDPDGISGVELYIDSRFIDILTESPFEWTLDPLPTGNHTITILAEDSKGLATGKTHTFSYAAPSSVQNKQISEDANMLSVFPNRVSSHFLIKYRLIDLSPSEFTLYDSNGKLVQKRLINNHLSLDGEYIWNLDSSLAKGVYYLSMQQNKQKVATCKLIKIE